MTPTRASCLPALQFAARRNCRAPGDGRHTYWACPTHATAATAGMSIMPRAPSTNSTPPPATGAAYDLDHADLNSQ